MAVPSSAAAAGHTTSPESTSTLPSPTASPPKPIPPTVPANTDSQILPNPLVDPLPAGGLFAAPAPEPDRPTPPRNISAQRSAYPDDPMRRDFPKPAGDIDVAEALARQPLPWTLGHWRRNSKEIVPMVETEEVKRQKFEEAKAKLLQEHATLNQGSAPK